MSADGDFMRAVRQIVPPMPLSTFESIVRSRECAEDYAFIMREAESWRDGDKISASAAWNAYSPAFEIWVEKQTPTVRAKVRDAKEFRDKILWGVS